MSEPRRTPVYGRLAQLLQPDLAAYVFAKETVFHAGLVLERYLPAVVEATRQVQFDSEAKGSWLRSFVAKANAAWHSRQAPWRAWARRHREVVKDWKGAVPFTLRPRWRWIVGLGNQTILETGITLHHTFGTPFIPGSGLKGLTQALVELDPPDGITADQKVALFGEQPAEQHREARHAAGEVVFLGAVPVDDDKDARNAPRLVVDVMTPHFPKYYQGERKDPLEVEDPKPIPFLTVAGGEYLVAVAPRRPATPQATVVQAAVLCRAALEDMGIGGKTAKGYGYFVEAKKGK